MLMDFKPIYKQRPGVRFVDLDSRSEWSDKARLAYLLDEPVSEKLASHIIDLSGYLQEVQRNIRVVIGYENNEILSWEMEKESYRQKGWTESKDKPGYFVNDKGQEIKSSLQYPVKDNLKETKLKEKGG